MERKSPRKTLLQFFALTYAVTWTCFFSAYALAGSSGSLVSALSFLVTPLLLLGTFAPSLVAIGLTARDDGIEGTRALLARLFDSGAAARWYLFAIGYWIAIKLTAALLYRLITGAWPPFGTTPWFVIVVAVIVSTPIQAGEEIGWRGYALPRLAERFGLARASLVLGLIWECWHLPLFFLPGHSNSGQSFPMFVLAGTALSVAMAWLYANTNGSLLLAMLMHAAVNNTNGIVPTRAANPGNMLALDTSLLTLLSCALVWITAGYFLVRMRHASSERRYSA